MSYQWTAPSAEQILRRWKMIKEATMGATAAFGRSNVGAYTVPIGQPLRRTFPYNTPPYKTLYSPWDPRTKRTRK